MPRNAPPSTSLRGRSDESDTRTEPGTDRASRKRRGAFPEWARVLFPPEKREYELVYHGKEREEKIIADTLAVPLQPVRTFGRNDADWHNMLIFGDNLQAMKTLLEMKKEG